MRVGYLHLIGGASGDMLLGALLDAGLPLEGLKAELAKLPVGGYRLETQQAQRRGLHGIHLRVIVEEADAPPRRWEDFTALVQKSGLASRVKERALEVFRRLAEAERRAHRIKEGDPEGPLDELGSLDTLVDVVGVVAGLERLGIQRLYTSPVLTGSGSIITAHGALPAAAPATMELIAMVGASVVTPTPGLHGELVTPTGAALITTLAEFRQPTLRLESIGYGLGSRDPAEAPNALALWIGEEETSEGEGALVLLETNIDDMNPQLFGYVQERLFTLGALDVWFTSIQMKKNRPGAQLSVLLPLGLEESAVALVLRETSTLGVRRRLVQRHAVERREQQVETSLGWLSVKVKYLEGRPVAVAPEYEACREVALVRGLPLQEVLRLVEQEAREQLVGDD